MKRSIKKSKIAMRLMKMHKHLKGATSKKKKRGKVGHGLRLAGSGRKKKTIYY
jgi:hypothetical protein